MNMREIREDVLLETLKEGDEIDLQTQKVDRCVQRGAKRLTVNSKKEKGRKTVNSFAPLCIKCSGVVIL